MNFVAITDAIDVAVIVTALGAIAALKILPPLARWGYNQVITWFR